MIVSSVSSIGLVEEYRLYLVYATGSWQACRKDTAGIVQALEVVFGCSFYSSVEFRFTGRRFFEFCFLAKVWAFGVSAWVCDFCSFSFLHLVVSSLLSQTAYLVIDSMILEFGLDSPGLGRCGTHGQAGPGCCR